MMDIGAIEQRPDRRNQHDVVGSNQFPQLWHSFVGPALSVSPALGPHEAFQPHRALAAFPGTFYCI
jgi:hypothetical protein